MSRRRPICISDYRAIQINAKDVRKGDLFVAIRGSRHDGHDYVKEAMRRGAAGCVVSAARLDERIGDDKRADIFPVRDTRETLSRLAAEYYRRPSEDLSVVGVTGTNGKTTISFLIERMLRDSGETPGVIGTIQYRIGNTILPADRTTPDAVTLQRLLRSIAEAGCRHAVIEVSSHAIHQKRVNDVYYDAAIFTNLTREHLDYHGTMKEYLRVKTRIFRNLKPRGVGIINNDDAYSRSVRRAVRSRSISYGIVERADVTVSDLRLGSKGARGVIQYPGGRFRMRTELIGRHNVSNILAAVAAGFVLELDMRRVCAGIERLQAPAGRLERIREGQPFDIFIDYAHTGDALRNVLATLRPYTKRRIITVFGCGGERDRSKRPAMGKIAASMADHSIITSDNPRSEDPSAIIEDIVKGVKKKKGKYSIIVDRGMAIAEALGMARRGDSVLIAGKGHETTQVIGDRAFHFDDGEVVRAILGK